MKLQNVCVIIKKIFQFEYSDETLTLIGNGSTDEYSTSYTPWITKLDRIETVKISSGITTIGENAFKG